MVDILGLPDSAAEVIDAQRAIPQQPLVLELFALQHPDGHWGDDPRKPYTAKGAVTVLSLLHMLGVQPDDRTTAGCDSLLRYCQHASGGFSMTLTRHSGIFPCTTGEHLPFLVYFGLGTDARVGSAFNYLIDQMNEPDALVCGRYQHQACLWGAIAALKGLAVLPDERRTVRAERVIRRLSEALLNGDYDFKGEHKRWLTYGVPRGWDLVSALMALAAHGYAQDPRFRGLLDLVLEKGDDRGMFYCGSVSRTWPIEKRNQPSKWVTLDVARVLKEAGLIRDLINANETK